MRGIVGEPFAQERHRTLFGRARGEHGNGTRRDDVNVTFDLKR
ncbi:MAG: hypothetical protein WDO56_36735 [Gammaproteobacteria bacterium]